MQKIKSKQQKNHKSDKNKENKLNLAYFSSFCPNRQEKAIESTSDGENQADWRSVQRMRV